MERLKTYYIKIDKRSSLTKVVNYISNGQAKVITIVNAEFKALTDIGNSVKIHYYETNKIDITDNR